MRDAVDVLLATKLTVDERVGDEETTLERESDAVGAIVELRLTDFVGEGENEREPESEKV